MIIVHQMAKVASMSWVEAARPAAALMGTVPLHTHFLTERNLQTLADILAAPPDDNTLVNPLIVRSMLRNGRRAAEQVGAARAAGQAVRLISGMRDPVARSVSLLSFFADFCGHSARGLSARDGATADDVCATLEALWCAILAGTEPRGSFERLLWHMIGMYRSWFDQEFGTVFGLDVRAAPFPGGGVLRLHARGIEALVYRAEDLTSGATGRHGVLDAAHAFLGGAGAGLPAINTAATRRSYPLYVATRDRFRLPLPILDAIYAAPIVRHFYRDEEIAAFKAHWQRPPR